MQLNQTLPFIINSIGDLFLVTILLRFLLQLTRADFYNPISQAVIKITAPLLNPLRRIIPGFFNVDMASLVLALMVQIILHYVLLYVGGTAVSAGKMVPFTFIFVAAIYNLLILLLNIYFYSLIIMAIASWVAPRSSHPALILTYQLMDPPLRQVRRFIPPIGGLDFSLMALMLCIVVLESIVTYLFGGFY